MLVWIENAPKYKMNTEDEVIQYVDTFLTRDSEDPEIPVGRIAKSYAFKNLFKEG